MNHMAESDIQRRDAATTCAVSTVGRYRFIAPVPIHQEDRADRPRILT